MVTERIRLPNYLVGSDLGVLRKNENPDDSMFGEIEGLQQAVDELETYHLDLTDRVTENEKSFTSFSQQFMPGRTYIQGLLYKLVYEATIPLTSGQQRFFPGNVLTISNNTATVGFDVSADLQHAFYDISAFVLEAPRLVVYNGSLIAGNDISLGVVRVYKTGPPRLESFLSAHTIGASVDAHVKVYRKIGIS